MINSCIFFNYEIDMVKNCMKIGYVCRKILQGYNMKVVIHGIRVWEKYMN